MAGFKGSAKYVLGRIGDGISNHVSDSDVRSALYNSRFGRTYLSVDAKPSVKNDKRDLTSSLIGIGAAIGEAGITSPLLVKANNLSLNVREVGGELYKISPLGEKLDWFEKAVYPLVNIKIGPFPLTTVLWGAASIATGAVTYYLAHRKLKD